MTTVMQSPPNLTPPMQPGPLGPGRRPVWPMVIGIIAIVFGGLGALAGIWGFFAPLLMRMMLSAAAKNEPALAAMERWRWWTLTHSTVTLLLALLLLSGGIALISKRRRAPAMLQAWSVLRIVFVPITAVFMWQMTSDQAAAALPPSPGAPPAGLVSATLIFSIGFGLLWGLALPVFMLVFLRLESSRRITRDWS